MWPKTLATLLLLAPCFLHAEFFEVRRNAEIFEQPDKNSNVLALVDPREGSGITILHIQDSELSDGYLLVRLPEGEGTGWIYKSMGRRWKDRSGPYIPYKRALYRHWIDQDKNCRDTRQEVLIRDSVVAVNFEDGRNCSVTSGSWADPYTAETFSKPLLVDIDHFVPLKNAHESGAWAWPKEKKERYANYLEDPMHLLAVKASENRKKGDKGPDRYMPPNAAFHCLYVQEWARIKNEWGLAVSTGEQKAINDVLSTCH